MIFILMTQNDDFSCSTRTRAALPVQPLKLLRTAILHVGRCENGRALTRRIFAREFLMSTQEEGGIDQLIFRGTDRHTGRHVSITPGNSSMKHLAYGRIILNAGEAGGVIFHGRSRNRTDRALGQRHGDHGGQGSIAGAVRCNLYSTRFFGKDRNQLKRGHCRVFGGGFADTTHFRLCGFPRSKTILD